MAVRFEYDAELKLLVLTFTGVLLDAELGSAFHYTKELAKRYPVRLGILDGTGLTDVSLSSELVQSLAHQPTMLPEDSDRAIVAPQDFLYGMARMYQMMGGESRERLCVVRTMEQAYEHLRIEAPQHLLPIEA